MECGSVHVTDQQRRNEQESTTGTSYRVQIQPEISEEPKVNVEIQRIKLESDKEQMLQEPPSVGVPVYELKLKDQYQQCADGEETQRRGEKEPREQLTEETSFIKLPTVSSSIIELSSLTR
jgi:hypothetical protein